MLEPERPARRSGSVMLPIVAMLVLVIGGGAFATMAFMPHLIFQAFPVPGTTIEVVPELKRELEAAPEDTVEIDIQNPGFLDRVLAMFDRDKAPAKGPLAYLPPAPKGWVRVTQSDVQQPDYMQTLSTSWVQTGGVPLDQNAGYKRLEQFVKTYAEPGIEANVMSKHRSKAFYLNTRGEYLVVRLEFLPQRGALGESTNASIWIESLSQRETKKLKNGEILEKNELAGIPVTNRVKPHGESLLSRPIDDKYDVPNGMKLAVPLTHRAVMKIEGLSTPTAAAALIETVDRFALNDLLAS